MVSVIPYYVISVFALIAILSFSNYMRKRRMLRALKKGRRLEEKGAILLQSSGYRIIKSQPTGTSRICVDKQTFDKVIKADFLVKKGGKCYVVEVKGGEVVRDPTSSSTRRQLLEYYSCFQASDLLFVDAIKGNIHKIEFPDLHPKNGVLKFFVGFGAGVLFFWFSTYVTGF